MRKVKVSRSKPIIKRRSYKVFDYYDIDYIDNNVIIYALCSISKKELLDILYGKHDKFLGVDFNINKEELRATKIAIKRLLKQERENEKS